MPTLARLDLPAPAHGEEAVSGTVAELLEPAAEVYAALVLGLRDYVSKNGFKHVVMGALGRDRLGAGGGDRGRRARVGARRRSSVMPSPYSSADTQRDAHQLAANLGVEPLELPIEQAMRAYDSTL